MASRQVFKLVAIIIVGICCCAMAVLAQTGNDLNQGLQSFAKYDSTDVDSVNISNASLAVHIPLWSYQQRGGALHLGLSIYFNSPTFSLNATEGIWTPTGYHQSRADLVWNSQPSILRKDTLRTSPPITYQYSTISVVDPDGAQHKMGAVPTAGGDSNLTSKLYATDASGYYIDSTTPTAMVLYDSHGNKYAVSGGVATATDTNGNRITFNSNATITDTIGRSLPAVPAPVANGCNTMQLPGQGSGQVVITLCYNADGRLTKVELPNGASYQFAYESFVVDQSWDGGGYELTQITLPTGGTISYRWETHEQGISAVRTLHSRTVNDGTGNQTWTYTWGTSGSNRAITAIDPLNQKTVHTVQDLGGPFPGTWEEVQSDQQNNQGTLLKTTTTAYVGSGPGPILPSTITAKWPNGQQKQEARHYGAQFNFLVGACLQLPCIRTGQSQYTGYLTGNPATVTDSDYGSGARVGRSEPPRQPMKPFPAMGFQAMPVPAAIATAPVIFLT